MRGRVNPGAGPAFPGGCRRFPPAKEGRSLHRGAKCAMDWPGPGSRETDGRSSARRRNRTLRPAPPVRVGAAVSELPIFPLGTVLFPGGPLPLRIFEPRYLDMVSDCLRNERPFGVCLIRSGSEVGEPADPHRTGTLARITDWGRDDRGILTVAAVGETRFRLAGTRTAPDRLLLGECEEIAEARGEVPAEYRPLARLARTLTERFASQYRHAPPPPSEDSGEAATWIGYRLAELLPIPMQHRQHLLELDDPVARLRRIDRVVALMAEAARSDGSGSDDPG